MVGTKLRPLHVILRLRYKIEVARTIVYICDFHYLHLIVSRSLRSLA